MVRSVRQDIWMMRVARACGLDTLQVPANAGTDPVVFDALLSDIIKRIWSSGVVGDLLAGVLLPADQTAWTEPTALATREYLLELTDPEEKQLLFGLMGRILSGFLAGDRSSSGSSDTVSAPRADRPAPPSARADGSTIPGSPGAASSANSPATIPPSTTS
jgi:hypothetical protein